MKWYAGYVYPDQSTFTPLMQRPDKNGSCGRAIEADTQDDAADAARLAYLDLIKEFSFTPPPVVKVIIFELTDEAYHANSIRPKMYDF